MPRKQIVKTEPLVNIEEVVNPLNNVSEDYSDDEIQAPLPTAKPIAKPVKKTINITDEERERRRQVMLKVREKKMDNVKQRNTEKDLYMQQQAEVINEKVIEKPN
jgi:hypothetical protein